MLGAYYICRFIPIFVYIFKTGKNESLCLHLFLRVMFSKTEILTGAKNVRTKIIDKVKYKFDTENFTLELSTF
jgi:hypothetical protein